MYRIAGLLAFWALSGTAQAQSTLVRKAGSMSMGDWCGLALGPEEAGTRDVEYDSDTLISVIFIISVVVRSS